MPVYNAELYLEDAINSILNQTYQNFELIISYDDSSDGSLRIIKKLANLDPRIIISSGKNRGIIKALNDGLGLARGDYLARMDADDISLPSRFEKQINFMESHPHIGICGTWIEVFQNSGKNYILKYPVSDKLLKLKLLFSVSFAHPTVLIKHDLISKHKIKYHESYETIEDYKLWLDLSKHTYFGVVPEILLKYRHLETSLSKIAQKDKKKRYEAHKKIFAELLERLNLENTEEENYLHYTLALNSRIANESIDLKPLNEYLTKLIRANESNNIFDMKSLKSLLAKKFCIVIYFKLKNKELDCLSAIFYKFFWYGPFLVFNNKNL